MKRELVKQLRANQTDAEAKLWRELRRKQVGAVRFRRQFPIGPYIVDFVCLQRKLVIELDGGQHAEQVEGDSQRTAWLNTQGFQVMRFWNNDVLSNVEGVVAMIIERLNA